MTKSEFARHIGVVPSRITRMIADGIIGADALVGVGRGARVQVELALRQVQLRRHVGQALGNGLTTVLDSAPSAGASTLHLDRATDDTARQIQLERLVFERRRNRQATLQEAQDSRRLVPVEELERAVSRAAQSVLAIFAGIDADLAVELAPKCDMPERDIRYAVKKVVDRKRAAVAATFRAAAEAMPETVEVKL